MSTTVVNPRSHGTGADSGPALNGREDYGGARLLVSDMRVAILLLDEARCAIVARLFGVARDDSGLVSMIAVGTLVLAAHDRTTRVLRRPGRPSVTDSMLGSSVLRELAHWLAGDLARDTPIFGTLLALGFLGSSLRPVVRGSRHGITAASHQARTGFDRRYGHLIPRRRPRP
jgi:hypothetical protein